MFRDEITQLFRDRLVKILLSFFFSDTKVLGPLSSLCKVGLLGQLQVPSNESTVSALVNRSRMLGLKIKSAHLVFANN